MKVKASLKTCLLLVIIFSGALSLFMLQKPIRFGYCSDGVKVVPDDFSKISWAVGNTSDGDTILVKPGIYFESQILVDKTIRIVGESAEATVIDGKDTAPYIFHVIASNVIIENFTMKNTDPDPSSYSYAVQIYNATNVDVRNVIISHVVIGVDVRSSNFTNITYNSINDSIMFGIRVRDTNRNNTIMGNTVRRNPTGIIFTDIESKFNKVYHNNFMNNTHQAVLATTNFFDDDYPSGGNFWSDHVSSDLYHGPDQNLSGGDGIFDEGYPIGFDNPWDKYPLVHPFSKFEVEVSGEKFEVQVITNSSLNSQNFDAEAKKLVLFLDGAEGTNGSCRISIPKSLLSCDLLSQWNASVYNGNQIPYLALEDEDQTYLYFTYNHTDTDGIEIEGTNAVPEFTPIVTALTLLLITAIIIISRNGLKRKAR